MRLCDHQLTIDCDAGWNKGRENIHDLDSSVNKSGRGLSSLLCHIETVHLTKQSNGGEGES